jgi:hypothetical protein
MSGSLRFAPTETDLKAAYALHMLSGSKKRWLIMTAIGLIAGIVVAVITELEKPKDIMLMVGGMLAWALAISLFLYLFTRFLWLPRFVRRVYTQQKDLQRETDVIWDATGFTAENANGKAFLQWEHFHRWRRSKSMLLLYRSDALFNFLPLHDPDFAQAADEMIAHLQAAGVKEK